MALVSGSPATWSSLWPSCADIWLYNIPSHWRYQIIDYKPQQKLTLLFVFEWTSFFFFFFWKFSLSKWTLWTGWYLFIIRLFQSKCIPSWNLSHSSTKTTKPPVAICVSLKLHIFLIWVFWLKKLQDFLFSSFFSLFLPCQCHLPLDEHSLTGKKKKKKKINAVHVCAPSRRADAKTYGWPLSVAPP